MANTFVVYEYQDKKLGTWIIKTIKKSPELRRLRRWQLSIRDAHNFYKKFGFHALEYPDRHMTIKNHNVYKKNSN